MTRGPFGDVVGVGGEAYEKVAVVVVGDEGHDRQQETLLVMALSRVYAVDPGCWRVALGTLDQPANDL